MDELCVRDAVTERDAVVLGVVEGEVKANMLPASLPMRSVESAAILGED